MSRAFKGLRDRGPEPSYDAVIIGAGIGGLICANLLAREGLQVLLVEQHYMAGGYCSTFRRAGFTFDAATHFYPLLGNPTTITGKLLGDLGIRTGWVKMDPVDTFHFPDGSRFEVPADFEAYMRKLKAEFPHEVEGIDRFFADVEEAYMHGLLYFFRQRKTERYEALRRLTMRDALDKHFRDRKLKLLLTADCPHWGSPPNRTSFVFDSMLRLSYFLGNYYPELGSQAFADEMALRFEERGGDIMMSTKVEEIVVEDGAARGVRLETTRGRLTGRHAVRCGVVISNADLLQTVQTLLPAGTVDPGYLATVRGLKPSFPCFLSHIGIDGVPGEMLERAQGYYWNDWDPDRVGRNGLRCKVFVPTLYEPRMAPPGKHVVILQKVLDMEHFKVDDWQVHKQEIQEYVTGSLERAVPGIREKIVVQTSATAMTSARFTLNAHGAMLGWEMSPEQLGDNRPGNTGPVRDLFMVGHWIQPGGGITPVIISAAQVARAVIGSSKDGVKLRSVRPPRPAPGRAETV